MLFCVKHMPTMQNPTKPARLNLVLIGQVILQTHLFNLRTLYFCPICKL